MAAAAILDFQNFKLSTVGLLKKIELRRLTNLVEIDRTVAAIWRFFDFSNMAAVRHLGFVVWVIGPPTKGVWWFLSLCKICLESMQ